MENTFQNFELKSYHDILTNIYFLLNALEKNNLNIFLPCCFIELPFSD